MDNFYSKVRNYRNIGYLVIYLVKVYAISPLFNTLFLKKSSGKYFRKLYVISLITKILHDYMFLHAEQYDRADRYRCYEWE